MKQILTQETVLMRRGDATVSVPVQRVNHMADQGFTLVEAQPSPVGAKPRKPKQAIE